MATGVDSENALTPPDDSDVTQISQVPYLAGLDGMRAIAVVAVMLYHANSDWLAGGFLGVEIFFVISGYLITLLIIAEQERTGHVDLRMFWTRRARRLLPALFVMMALVTIWVALFERDALGKLRGDVIAGLLYVSNWYQIIIGAGYSAGADFAPLRHLWSLAVEEQFYLLWPLVMIVLVRRGSRGIASTAKWLFLASVLITVVVAFLNYDGPQQTPELTPDAYWWLPDWGFWFFDGRPISIPDALYLSTMSRAGGLMLGSAFAMVWRPTAIMRSPLRTKNRQLDLIALVGFIGLTVMSFLVTFQPDQGVGFLFTGGLFLTGLLTLFLIAAVTHEGTVTSRLLALPLLLWIGTRSYGLYLYHWPIYQLIRNIAANKMQFHEWVLAMVATVIITEASYRFIETPIRKGTFGTSLRRLRTPRSNGQRRGAIAGAFVGAALFVYAGASMATAELKQNSVAEIIDQNSELRCDLVTGENCDTSGDGAAPGDAGADPASVDGSDAAPATVVTDGTTAGGEAAPATTVVVAAAPAKVAIGDSVMLGALVSLQELGFDVDAIESRSWNNGVELVETLERQGRLPEVLVIHLGTNGPIGQENMDRMMAAVADVPEVLLLTNSVDREWIEGNNALIYDAAGRLDNVSLLDWQGLIRGCQGECLENDGFHLKPAGREYYALLISEVLGAD
jgi:peptidoglycan/LPS O-acetylase OafA/YrhL